MTNPGLRQLANILEPNRGGRDTLGKFEASSKLTILAQLLKVDRIDGEENRINSV